MWANTRRPEPEPPPGPPHITFTPGLADQTLRELAPLLAEEGIDVNNIDVPDVAVLQAALNRAVERHKMARFTPVGTERDDTVSTLRLVIEAITDNNTSLAAAILDTVPPDSDGTSATVASCIGLGLGLLDDWLSDRDNAAPGGLAQQTQLPAGQWLGKQAGTNILVLARKGRAFRSLDTLIVGQGGKQVLYGAALSLAGTLEAWAQLTSTTAQQLSQDHIS